ncbi:unnamed protein product [Closterium sp. Yama58-4]|nr:unnamed protein product [Closterium sp. Yama58-4]
MSRYWRTCHVCTQLLHIRGMGFDALLIGPVTVNSPYGYHGYWPRGFTMPPGAGGEGDEGNYQTAINPHLGTSEELKALVDAAHAMGFLVMPNAPYFSLPRPLVPSSPLPPFPPSPLPLFPSSPIPPSRLPLFHTSSPLVLSHPPRHPPVVLNHVGCPQGGGPCDTWQEGIRPPPWLNNSYAPFNKSAAFHPPCEVDFSQYDADNWQRCWLASLPDFNQSNPTVAAALVRSTVFEGAGNPDFQGSFLDNHDSPRLLGLLHGDQLLLHNALVLLLTSRGIPLVYSGTEQAFMGGPDPQNRESLWPFLNTHHPLYGFLAAVIRFRQKVALWQYKQQHVRFVSTHLLVFQRGPGVVAVTNSPADAEVLNTVHVTGLNYKDGTILCNQLADNDCIRVVNKGGIRRLPWNTLTVAQPNRVARSLQVAQPRKVAQPFGVSTTGLDTLHPLREAFANPCANWRLSPARVSCIVMASAGDAFCDPCDIKSLSPATTGAANNAAHPAAKILSHVSQAAESTFDNPAKPAVSSNPTSETEHGDGNAAKVPGKKPVGRMDSSDPLALLKALAPMQVLIGAGMLTALLLPRPLALALTAAALLPPILRTTLHSWRWSHARKGGSGGGASGGKGERGKNGEGKAEGKGEVMKGEVGAEREGLLGEVLFEADKTMANGKGSAVGGRHNAAASGNLLSVNGMDIFQGRMAGKMDGDFCLFLIGARANNPFPLSPAFASVGEVFGQAVRELEQESERFGFLGGDHYVGTDMTRGSQTIAVMYWRSYDDLVNYANDQTLVHGSAWKRMTQLLRDGPGVGVWHESYAISAGQYESIYVNCPAFGLGAAGKLVPAFGPLATSRGRMREGGGMKKEGGEEEAEKLPEDKKVGGGKCPMGF